MKILIALVIVGLSVAACAHGKTTLNIPRASNAIPLNVA